MGEIQFDRKHGLVSFDGGERWYLQECLDMLRGLHLLSGMIRHVPSVTITAVDHETGTVTVGGGWEGDGHG